MKRIVVVVCVSVIGVIMSQVGSNDVPCCPVLELRQYTLKPERRDALINLFDRHFVESQEAVGMTVVGQFRDRGDANRFVWLRGFPNMESRHRALEAFYGGPVWAAHKNEANDTMLDSDNVLLLKPARPELGFVADSAAHSHSRGPVTVISGIYEMPGPIDTSTVSLFERQVAPVLRTHQVTLKGVFVTESSPNTFRLPVREGENVLVWFGTLEGRASSREWLENLAGVTRLEGRSASLLELEPTSRSVLGYGQNAARATKHDFDFLFGAWKVHNRYLNTRLRNSTDWIEFEGRANVQPLLNGFGHIDQYSAVREGQRLEGITVRLFNPATAEWSLYWADTMRAPTFLPVMVGRFVGDVSEFFGDETVDGKRVLCRYRWTNSPAGSPRWEQAFSGDNGQTWETNWIMTLTRP